MNNPQNTSSQTNFHLLHESTFYDKNTRKSTQVIRPQQNLFKNSSQFKASFTGII